MSYTKKSVSNYMTLGGKGIVSLPSFLGAIQKGKSLGVMSRNRPFRASSRESKSQI